MLPYHRFPRLTTTRGQPYIYECCSPSAILTAGARLAICVAKRRAKIGVLVLHAFRLWRDWGLAAPYSHSISTWLSLAFRRQEGALLSACVWERRQLVVCWDDAVQVSFCCTMLPTEVGRFCRAGFCGDFTKTPSPVLDNPSSLKFDDDGPSEVTIARSQARSCIDDGLFDR